MRVSDLPRPSPERLLRQAQAEENKRWGARLKIFLGYAPGVGKSYRMLDEARRRHDLAARDLKRLMAGARLW